MDISFECNVSLSKRLRSILEDSEARIVLVAENIRDGKGVATLMVSGDNLNLNSANQSLGKETSIQFTPTSVKDEVPTNQTVTNLFSTNIQQTGQRTAVDKIAVTAAPEKNQVAHAIKREEEIATPEAFAEVKEPEYQSFVSNFTELMMAVKAAQGKESEIDLDSIENPRQRALAAEMKEQAEAIDIPAYIVNDKCSSVTLNDIDLSLALNTPVDLSNISAKRLAASGDLKSMLRSDMIKFISPEEVASYRDKAVMGVEKPGLETYSTRGDAENAIGMEEHVPQAEQVDIPVDDEAPSEQEQLAGLINLTPMSGGGEDGSVRTTFHGSAAPRSKQSIGKTSETNSQGLKTISRA